MHKSSSHPVHTKKTIEDWLFIAGITIFFMLIVAMTIFSTYCAFQYLPFAGGK